MKNSALYPGSFDPITFGHIDIIKRAVGIFDEVIVAVARNTQKNAFFSVDERKSLLKEATKDIKGIRIESFDGLVTDYAIKNDVNVIIRGLRMISDFEFEFQMALTNRRLASSVETVFLMPSEGYSFLSSTLIKEAVTLGADISSFVPECVVRQFKLKLK